MRESTPKNRPEQAARRSVLVVIAGCVGAFAAFTSNATNTTKNLMDFFFGEGTKAGNVPKLALKITPPDRLPEPVNSPDSKLQLVSFGLPDASVQKISPIPADPSTFSILHSFYRFGNQVLRADFEGEQIFLYYALTNETMSKLHAQDSLYGILSINGVTVSGWAQGRSEKCKPQRFTVSGFTSPDRASISFDGKFPMIDGDTCVVVEHRDAHVVLNRI